MAAVSASAPARKTVAVVMGVVGGMGDVGKFALLHALASPDRVCVRPVIMFLPEERPQMDERGRPLLDVDVRQPDLARRVTEAVAEANPVLVELGSPGARKALDGAFSGADAIVAAVGNRQPFKTRSLAASATLIRDSALACGVPRLVLLSSFGIGSDPQPWGWIRVLWAVMLSTVLRSAWHDLLAMEEAVSDNGGNLDVVLVRTVGITPEMPPVGLWRVVRDACDPPVELMIAKGDVAQFMLEEALVPDLHNTAVTVGSAPGAYAEALAQQAKVDAEKAAEGSG